MSGKALFVVLVLGAVAWPGTSHAEKVKTNQRTEVHSRAGERSPVLLTVKSGQAMTILDKDGRWLKVRVAGRTGWIPRSKVDMPEGDDLVRNTRRRPFVDGRGTRRGFGGDGGPDDRVGADATGEGAEPAGSGARGGASDDEDDRDRGAADDDDDDRPSKGSKGDDGDGDDDDGDEAPRPMARVAKATAAYNDPRTDSDESFTAQPRTALYIVERKGKWTFVENDEGDAGYVLTSRLEIDEPGGRGGRARRIEVRGRLGGGWISQAVATPVPAGTMGAVPDNYSAGSQSVTISLGGSVLYPYAARAWIGGELAYDFNKAIPGIDYQGATTGFSYHNLNLRAVGGYDLRKRNGMLVFARLGYHYDSFQVPDVSDFTRNTAKLPSQIISALTLGAALDIPRLTEKLGLKVSLDTILFGASVQQTRNLEDGTGPSAKAAFLGAVVTYRWKPRMDIQVNSDLGYTSLSFAGPPPTTSMRGHVGTGPSSGSDLSFVLTGGVAYAF